MIERSRIFPIELNNEKKFIWSLLDKRLVLLSLVSFLLGRSGILQGLTPFGIGFFAALNYKERKYAYVGLTTFLGIISVQGAYRSIPYGITLLVIYLLFYYIMDLRKMGTFKAAFLSGFTYLTSSMIMASFTSLYLYDVMMMGFEALVIFTTLYISTYALPLLTENKNRRILSTEEIICLAILAAVALSGINEFYIFQLSLRNILTIFLTLLFAYNGGTAIGASVGITLGLITTMSFSGMPPVFIGILGFSGLLAGTFNDMGKLGSGLGFLMGNTILTFYINGYHEGFIKFTEIFLALGLIMLIPSPWIKEIEKFWKNPKNILYTDLTHGERVRKRVHERLSEFSGAFFDLATTFEKVSDKYEIFEREELTNLIQEMADTVCHNCGMRRNCWERNFNRSYQSMVDLMVLIETRGSFEKKDLPQALQRSCIHPEKVVEKLVHLYELSSLDMTWRQRFVEGRELVGQQIKGVSYILEEMAQEFCQKAAYNIDLENQIYLALDRAGLTAGEITVVGEEKGGLEILIQDIPQYNRENNIGKFIPTISQALDIDLAEKMAGRNYHKGQETKSLTLVEANKYTALTKVAKANKDGNTLSGDTHSFMEINEDEYLVALSDGMGTGQKAHRQSNATITMLEKMMETGFDKEIAIKSINSILMLKSSEEIFSSLDMATINLRRGKVDFIKTGSAPSYIKRKKGKIEKVTASTLPIGILKNIEFNEEVQEINDGDFIIMVSDGILEANKEEGEEWLPAYLKTLDTGNPQDMADKILHRALEFTDNRARDDMTVLVTKLWKTEIKPYRN